MCEAEYIGIVQHQKCDREGEHKQHHCTWEEPILEGSRKGQVTTYETWW